MEFKAEKDIGAFLIPLLILVISILFTKRITIIAVVIIAVFVIFLVVNMCTLKYSLSYTELVIQSLWGKKRIDLSKVSSTKRISGGYSMSASSGHQVALYSEDTKLVAVSPKDIEAFENELLKRIKNNKNNF